MDPRWRKGLTLGEAGNRPGGWTVRPGRSNLLEVSPDREELGCDAVRIGVTLVLPDTTVRTLEAEVDGEKPTAAFELGPFTAPPQYEFEAGVVYQRGYRLGVRFTDSATDTALFECWYHQALSDTPREWRQQEPDLPAGVWQLVPGDEDRVIYNPLFGVESPLSLRLSDRVLSDCDDLDIQVRLNPGATVDAATCRLQVTAVGGRIVHTEPLRLVCGAEWATIGVDPKTWPMGDYGICLWPEIEGRVWEEGPRITYHRRSPGATEVRVTPYAPWVLGRDPDRKVLTVTDFREACGKWGDGALDPSQWELRPLRDATALISTAPPGSWDQSPQDPTVLSLPLSGPYAVFARPLNQGCLFQAGDDGLIRVLRGSPDATETFVCARDPGDWRIRIYPFDNNREPDSGLAGLRFVPVNRESLESFKQNTHHPPTPLTGVNDWSEYFDSWGSRLAADQFETLVGAQVELGMRTMDWSVGRSWVEYHSSLPGTTRFPCVPLEQAIERFEGADRYRGRITMINRHHPLQSVMEDGRRHQAEIRPWLGMQRHYGGHAYGGLFASRFFRQHPEYRRWRKNAAEPDRGEVCYFFPGVRRERLDILLEVARRGAAGVVIGCCRQVPMLLYHPEMVGQYRERTGVDPQRIDARDGEAYRDWIRWRADFFTQLLRDLRAELVPIAKQRGESIPVAVRIPSAGLFYNMAQGLDVEQWLREDLVDQLQLDPLEDRGGHGSHDVDPYVKLGRAYAVMVMGGIGQTWSWRPEGYVVGLKRALGLIDAGVDGIELYETEVLAQTSMHRWIVPLFGDRTRIMDFLGSSNLEACYPTTASNAAIGHDNHSQWTTGEHLYWSTEGRGPTSL